MTNSGQITIPVGYVRRAHGIRGDVVVRGLADDAADRLAAGATFDTNEEPPRTLTVDSVQVSGSDFRVHFTGIDDRNAAEDLKGKQLVIDVGDRRVLAQGEWWPEDLVGCQVVGVDGEPIGELVEVIIAGVQDRLVVVNADGARAEIPFVEVLVPHVDADARIVTVDLPEGLFE